MHLRDVVTLRRYEKRDVRYCIRPVYYESTWIRYTQNEDGLKCFGLGALFSPFLLESSGSCYFTSQSTVSYIAGIRKSSLLVSLDVLNIVLLWVSVGSFGKITDTTMIYSVDQVAQERGYPLSMQCHQYLEGSCFFFFLLMILTCLTHSFLATTFLKGPWIRSFWHRQLDARPIRDQ